jgi:uncharacterized protein YdgA (DUF945 family)
MHPLIKKIIIILIFLSFLPLLTGFLVKRQYSQLLAAITELSEVELETKEYHRGWFHSSAVSEVTFPQEGHQAPLIFRIEHLMDHGPFLKHGHFLLAAIHSELLPLGSPLTQSLEVSEKPLMFHTTIGLTGYVIVDLEVAQLDLESQDQKMHIIGEDIEEHWLFSNYFSDLDWSLSAGSLNILMDDREALILSELYSEKMLHKNAKGVWFGEAEWQVNQLENKTFFQGAPFVLQDILWKHQSEEVEDLLKVTYAGSVNSLQYQDELYGPFKIALVVDRLNSESLTLVEQWMRDAKHTRASNSSTVFWRLASILSTALETRPHLKLNQLQLDLPSGLFQATGEVSLGGPGIDLRQPATLAQSVDATAHIEVPQKILKSFFSMQLPPGLSVDTYLKTLEDDKMLSLTHGLYKTDLSLQNGQLLLNGKRRVVSQKEQ